MERAVVVAIALTCASCKKAAPDCEGALGAAFDRVAKIEFRETLPDHRRHSDVYASSWRGRVVKSCRSDEWSAESIECFASSKKASEVQSCASTFTEKQLASLRSNVDGAILPSVGGFRLDRTPLEVFGLAQDDLREATRELVAAGLPSDPRGSTADEDMTRARESIMSEKEVPVLTLENAVLLAFQYRFEVAMPALILARSAK